MNAYIYDQRLVCPPNAYVHQSMSTANDLTMCVFFRSS